jgi:hypothetical protein
MPTNRDEWQAACDAARHLVIASEAVRRTGSPSLSTAVTISSHSGIPKLTVVPFPGLQVGLPARP